MASLSRALLPALVFRLAHALLSSHAASRAGTTPAPVSTNSSAEASCRAACGCGSDVAFIAATAAARELYVGCEPTSPPVGRRPAFLAIGAQKAGTTSFFTGAGWGMGAKFCPPHPYVWPGEVHFFDNPKWLSRSPDSQELQDGYLSQFLRCGETDWFEKTPGYLYSSAAPLRVCEAFPQTPLVALLRDPVERAYSSFYKGHGAVVPLNARGFHTFATADVAIARECGGMPTGDPARDLAEKGAYQRCCERVTAGLNLTDWPGCGCEVPEDHPYLCTVHGRRDFAVVRMGIYAPQLRNWLRYHRSEDLHLLFSEDFFQEMPGAFCQFKCRFGPEATEKACTRGENFEAAHKQSWVADRPRMLPETRRLLRDFYRPHNEELFALLGRRARWGE